MLLPWSREGVGIWIFLHFIVDILSSFYRFCILVFVLETLEAALRYPMDTRRLDIKIINNYNSHVCPFKV